MQIFQFLQLLFFFATSCVLVLLFCSLLWIFLVDLCLNSFFFEWRSMKVKHVWHLSINWGRSEKMVGFFLQRAWQDILKGSESFQGEILLSFFAGEMQRWKLFNFFLLDHVRQSWAECLFKETLKLLSFLYKVGHSTFQNSLLETSL